MTALAGPSAKEKLLERFWHAKFGLTQIATRAIYSVQINRNRGFITLCHTLYVATNMVLVKVRIAAVYKAFILRLGVRRQPPCQITGDIIDEVRFARAAGRPRCFGLMAPVFI